MIKILCSTGAMNRKGMRADVDDRPEYKAEALRYERFTYISSGGGITSNYRKQIV